MDFEDLLITISGNERYQFYYIWFFFIPVSTLTPWLTMITIFMVSTPKFICSNNLKSNMTEDELDHFFSTSNISADEECYFKVNDKSDTRIEKCTNWTYDRTDFGETYTSYNNLVCDKDYFADTALAAISVGQAFGSPIFGLVADKYGRKVSYLAAIFICFLSSFSPTFTKNTWSFIFFRFLHGLGLNTLFQLPSVMAIEFMLPEKRTYVSVTSNFGYSFGMCILPLYAYLTKDWYWISVMATICPIISLFLFKYLPESPRWLITKQRYKEAYKIFSMMAKFNGVTLTEDFYNHVKGVGEKFNLEEKEHTKKISSWNQFTKWSIIFIVSLISFELFSAEFAVNGLHYNVKNLPGNEYLNYFLMALVEVPSIFIAWWLVETRLGRRWSATLLFLITGFSLIAATYFASIDFSLFMIFMILGKASASSTYMIITLHGAELLPTMIRNRGMSVMLFIASIGEIVIPYGVYLAKYGIEIPVFIIAVLNLIAGVVATLLPETKDHNLPQTLKETENLIRNLKFWSWTSSQ